MNRLSGGTQVIATLIDAASINATCGTTGVAMHHSPDLSAEVADVLILVTGDSDFGRAVKALSMTEVAIAAPRVLS